MEIRVGIPTLQMMVYLGHVDQKSLANIKAMIYDRRNKKSAIEQFAFGELLGLILQRKFNNNSCPGLLSRLNDNSWLLLATVFNKYTSMEPKIIGLSKGAMCQQRRESVVEWKVSRIKKVLFSNQVFRGNRGNVVSTNLRTLHWMSQPGLWLPEKAKKGTLREFMRASCYSYSTKYLNMLPLPLFFSDIEFRVLIKEWLVLMSWYIKVANELEPLSGKLEDTASTNTKLELTAKVRRILSTCQMSKFQLFNESVKPMFSSACYDISHLSSKAFEELSMLDMSDLETIIIKPPTKLFIESLFILSMGIAKESISYILQLRVSTAQQEVTSCPHEVLRNSILYQIQQFHCFVRKQYRKHFLLFKELDEIELFNMMLQRISIVLKEYLDVKHSKCHDSTDGFSSYRRLVDRMHNLLRDLIIEIAFSLIHKFYQSYKIKVVRECVEQIIQYITVLSTSLAVVHFWENSKHVDIPTLSAEIERKTVSINKARKSLPEFQDFVLVVADQGIELLTMCMELYSKQDKLTSMTMVSSSFIYDDFYCFQKSLADMFGTCPHPLISAGELLDSKLQKFMINVIIAFEQYTKEFEEVLLLAEHVSTVPKVIT